MPDFKQIQGDLQDLKKQLKQSQRDIFLSEEKLKKHDLEKEKILRSSDSNSNRVQDILIKERQLHSKISNIKSQHARQFKKQLDLTDSFQSFTDPRKHIQQFSDQYPILMFPVRLETRFKKITTEGADVQYQLWVRIFPDECSIDTFEDILSETEVSKVHDYWVTKWSAGQSDDDDLQDFIENKSMAAWRGLASNIDAGRAYWVTTHYIPENISELPERTNEDEIIIVIPTEKLPTVEQQNALKTYWKAIILANEEQSATQNALEQLITDGAVASEDKAIELIADYSPVNMGNIDLPAPGDPLPLVQVSFIELPKTEGLESKTSSWSQAARITSLPERFVLSGYKGHDSKGEPKRVLNELGAMIPDPLIMGPNPSMDTNKVLKNVLIEEFLNLSSDQLKEVKLASYYDDFKDTVKKEKVSPNDFISDFQNRDEEGKKQALEQIFDDLKDEVKAEKYIVYLTRHSETKWLFDFEDAIKVGMGFKVDLSAKDYVSGFDRLFVSGVKLGADESEAKTVLEELFLHHHYGSNGFSILPQGTFTNNTENEGSDFSEKEYSEKTYKRYFPKEEVNESSDPFQKTDGQWLSELLGIDADSASLRYTDNYNSTDQCESKAMNVALWNSTIGYFMESMLTSVFTDWEKTVTRDFFTSYVSGRGNIPAIRIGEQPYGIITTTAIKKIKWLDSNVDFEIEAFSDKVPVLRDIFKLIMKVGKDWEKYSEDVAYVGKDGDAHQILLDVLGLHASSVEFDQRYAESFAHLANRLKLTGFAGIIIRLAIEGGYKKAGLDLLKELGFTPGEEDDLVPILEKFFFTKANRLTRDLIDDRPLSESEKIRAYTTPENAGEKGENYIFWLIEAALSNHDKLKKQEGFSDKPPTALLYQMLRHSLDLGFSNTAFDFYRKAKILTSSQAKNAKIDADFIGIKEQPKTLESKYDYLDRKESRIVDQDISVAQFISNLLNNPVNAWQTNNLSEIIGALDHLKDVSTAGLERVFVEHLDCCTYRLDAWMLGFVHLQMQGMRYKTSNTANPDDNQQYKQGIYIGAYGWVEDLRPDDEELTEVPLNPELRAIFDPDNELNIVTDSSNGGYIHAPSINQAITGAVLRNAYISNASPEDPEIYKVNLSSERVRMALSIIEGMQQGQSLGALLGYQFERGLHDRYEEAEVDSYIYELRKKFPLISNHLDDTEESEDDLESITQIEARNVLDGLALVNHINSSGEATFPFGLAITEVSDSVEKAKIRNIISTEADRIINIDDAVADLAIAETVHQVVQSNYDRAAGVLETYSKGGFPQSPDVIKTPRSGVSITNRVGVHLKTGIDVTLMPNPAPRVIAEPAINDFLKQFLPPLSDIVCKVIYTVPSYDEIIINPAQTSIIFTIEELGISPIDLLYILDIESDKNLTALDDYILHKIHTNTANKPRPDIELEIKYTEFIPNKISLFEIAPLIKSLRSIILTSRPLQSSDMLLPNEANKASNLNSYIVFDRVNIAFTKFKEDALRIENDLLDIAFTNLIDEENFDNSMSNKEQIIDGIDDYIVNFISHLRSINKFGIPQAGFGFVYDRKAGVYSAFYKKVLEYKNRWEDKISKYDVLMNKLQPPFSPGDAILTDEQKIEILQQAERTISINNSTPLPDPPDVISKYRIIVENKKQAFDNKFTELTQWLEGNFVSVKDLVGELNKLRTGVGSTTGKGLHEFDLLSIEVEEDERDIIVLAEDLKVQAITLNAANNAIIVKAQEFINQYNIETNPIKKTNLLTEIVTLLFGEDFKIIPEFILNSEHGSELKKSYNSTDQILKYQHTEKASDFPVDDWLYGVARVRDKLSHWENVVVLAEGFKVDNTTFDLTPLQLPYKNNDSWLGLSFPETYEVENDKLLYTTYLRDFDETKPQCGLLIDEWTEVIPTENETTGLSFQYDQPNTEAPQSMLLLTPTDFTDQWDWADIEDTLHETLDLAKLRAVEPEDYRSTAYAQFLPATVSAVTTHPFLTIALNYAFNFDLTTQGDNDA